MLSFACLSSWRGNSVHAGFFLTLILRNAAAVHHSATGLCVASADNVSRTFQFKINAFKDTNLVCRPPARWSTFVNPNRNGTVLEISTPGPYYSKRRSGWVDEIANWTQYWWMSTVLNSCTVIGHGVTSRVEHVLSIVMYAAQSSHVSCVTVNINWSPHVRQAAAVAYHRQISRVTLPGLLMPQIIIRLNA